jgi:hypothetical protein
MAEAYMLEGEGNPMLRILVDNPPQWNKKNQSYVYDFKGRVTLPSIKNFQLIPMQDAKRGNTLGEFIL